MAEQTELQLEISKLKQRQRDELAVLAKDVKKKKGALKKAAQKKYDDMVAKHEEELAALTDAPAPAAPGESAAPSKPAAPKKAKRWPVLAWSQQPRSVLEECCAERGISKKGKKEDLVVRLNTFAQEQQLAFDNGELIEASEDESEDEESGSDSGSDSGYFKKKGEDDDDDESSSDGDEFADETPEEKEARERLAKRRGVVVGRLFQILQKVQFNQIALDELEEQLAEAGVKNFRPELVGYETNIQFLQEEQGKYFKYIPNSKVIKLVREHDATAPRPKKTNFRKKK